MELPPVDILDRHCSEEDYGKIKANELLNLTGLGCVVQKSLNRTVVSHLEKQAPYYNRIISVNTDGEGMISLIGKYQCVEKARYSLVIDDFSRPPEAGNILNQLGIPSVESVSVLGTYTKSLEINRAMYFENPPFNIFELTDNQRLIDVLLHSQTGKFFCKPGEALEEAEERIRYNLAHGFIFVLSDMTGGIVGMVGSVISNDGVASLFSGFVEDGSRKKGGSSLLILRTLERLKLSCDFCYLKSKNPVVIWSANKYFGLKPLYKETYYLL